MVAQGFLIGVLSSAVTAVIWSCMRSLPGMIEVFSKSWKVGITFATIAMSCDLLMILQFCPARESFFALLALWMLFAFMFESCLSMRESEATVEAAKWLRQCRSRHG